MVKVNSNNDCQCYFFKMVKSDTKLIRATLEFNEMRQTEQNNFSVCWLGNINNQSNKYQFFENLQEY